MKKLVPFLLLPFLCACSSPEEEMAERVRGKVRDWLEWKYDAVNGLEYSGEHVHVRRNQFDEKWSFSYSTNVSCYTMLAGRLQYESDTISFGGVYDPEYNSIVLDSYSSIKPRFK